MLNPRSGLDLARALTDKLAGGESLPDIIDWWIAAAWDSGYLESVTVDQLSWIELAATEIACTVKKNAIYKARGIPADDLDDPDDASSAWKELVEAREALHDLSAAGVLS
jgi:hypothetical protein